jgi:hypothetical protein
VGATCLLRQLLIDQVEGDLRQGWSNKSTYRLSSSPKSIIYQWCIRILGQWCLRSAGLYSIDFGSMLMLPLMQAGNDHQGYLNVMCSYYLSPVSTRGLNATSGLTKSLAASKCTPPSWVVRSYPIVSCSSREKGACRTQPKNHWIITLCKIANNAYEA